MSRNRGVSSGSGSVDYSAWLQEVKRGPKGQTVDNTLGLKLSKTGESAYGADFRHQ